MMTRVPSSSVSVQCGASREGPAGTSAFAGAARGARDGADFAALRAARAGFDGLVRVRLRDDGFRAAAVGRRVPEPRDEVRFPVLPMIEPPWNAHAVCCGAGCRKLIHVIRTPLRIRRRARVGTMR
jgi:hypothetical protein